MVSSSRTGIGGLTDKGLRRARRVARSGWHGSDSSLQWPQSSKPSKASSLRFSNVSTHSRISTPSKQDRKNAINLLPHTDVALRVFLDELPVGWLGALRERGFFAEPPRAERTETSIRFPAWVAGEYLARIAGDVPDQVAAILEEVPD